MKKLFLLWVISIFVVGCATNLIVNGKNVSGLIGASGGAYGGSVLCKNCKGIAKIAAIGGGALIGWLAGNKVGEYFDERDRQRRVKLIEDTLEHNRDNETSTDIYKKSWHNPNTGQKENHIVSQSVTPMNTYQPSNNFVRSGIVPLPNNHPDKWKEYTYTQPNQWNQMTSNQVCRDFQITISIEGLGQPTQQQFYRACRTEQGWRTVQ